MTLKYPNDRHNGYVMLTDGNGCAYVPDWDLTRTGESRGSAEGNTIRYAGAFLVLASRINRREK